MSTSNKSRRSRAFLPTSIGVLERRVVLTVDPTLVIIPDAWGGPDVDLPTLQNELSNISFSPPPDTELEGGTDYDKNALINKINAERDAAVQSVQSLKTQLDTLTAGLSNRMAQCQNLMDSYNDDIANLKANPKPGSDATINEYQNKVDTLQAARNGYNDQIFLNGQRQFLLDVRIKSIRDAAEQMKTDLRENVAYDEQNDFYYHWFTAETTSFA